MVALWCPDFSLMYTFPGIIENPELQSIVSLSSADRSVSHGLLCCCEPS